MDIIQLFDKFSVAEIVLFIILLAGSIRLVVEFKDWTTNKLNRVFARRIVDKELKQRVKALAKNEDDIYEHLSNLDAKVEMLMASDRDRLRAWLVEKHHFYCYEQKEIDVYTLDVMERMYKRYKDEGGNTYVDKLMEEVRALPIQEKD